MPGYDLVITFLSDWHVGSGLGAGPLADSILNRDNEGLPFLPGRAIKGALRESSWRLALGRPDLSPMEKILFGGHQTGALSNSPGALKAGMGLLARDLRDWLLGCDPERRAMFVGDMTLIRQQTALDENRLARDQSLRAMECGIPGLVFECQLEVDSDIDPAWLDAYFLALCAGVKSMGADRARGLGRCRVTIAGKEGLPAQLPPPPPFGANS